MTLSTFGAIMGFAAEMVKHSLTTYQTIVQRAKDTVFKEHLQGLLGEKEKEIALMEQTRRENVTEMILEPITGLHQGDYEFEVEIPDQAKDLDLLKIVLIFEEREQKFFQDSSQKVPLPEVARIFRKVAQKKEKNLTKLKSLGLNQP